MGVPQVIVVGAASRDLDASDPRGWRLGGGVTWSSRAAVGMGLAVGAVMGLDASAAQSHEVRALAAAGVQIEPVALGSGPVFDNRTVDGRRVQIAHAASDSLPASALPPAWRDACAWILNPVAGEIADDWAARLPQGALVALDCQGLVRRLVPGEPVQALPLQPGPLVARADLISISSEDAVAGAPPLGSLVTRDGQEVVIRDGPRGSIGVSRVNGSLRVERYPVVAARGPGDGTGAGDAFLAAWLVGRLALRAAGALPRDRRAIHLAALTATLVVEGAAIDRAAIRAIARRRSGGTAGP